MEPRVDNEANAGFVAAFRAEYGRIPSTYASQGYDTGLLLIPALDRADPSGPDAFRAADFASTRGDFRFNTNQHPIQDIHAREVVTGGDGTITNKLVGLALEDHADAYAAECRM
jgi:branched-chain amino acid transport system substrate-binding protein